MDIHAMTITKLNSTILDGLDGLLSISCDPGEVVNRTCYASCYCQSDGQRSQNLQQRTARKATDPDQSHVPDRVGSVTISKV